MRKFLLKYLIPISAIVGIIVISVCIGFLIIKVEITEVGVKTVNWGITRGVVQKDYRPGWHRYIRTIEAWDKYDVTIQRLILTRDALTPEGKIENRALPIRLADDYEAKVDIIVQYKIKKGKAHKIRQEIGPGDDYKQLVEHETKAVARNILGKMVERDLYTPEEKRKRAEEAKQQLAIRLQAYHVDVITWLILDVEYDPYLTRKIQNTKIADLNDQLHTLTAKAVEKRGITQTIDAETEAIAQTIRSDKNAEIVMLGSEVDKKVVDMIADANKFLIEKVAEGHHYKEERRAAGELLVDQAIAIGESMRRQAMTGMGGDLIVALEAARNINLGDIMVSTQVIDLLDIEKMINKLGAGRSDKPAPKELPEELRIPKELEEELSHGAHKETHQQETHEKSHSEETHNQHGASGKSHDERRADDLTKEYPVAQ